MPADTFSAGLGFAIMQTGNDNNTWGTIANASCFQIFEDAISGLVVEVVTGGTLDLSGSPPPAGPSQARYARIRITGTLTSNQTVIVPNLSKITLFENLTSGAFSVLVKVPSSASIQIPQGSVKHVVCNGAGALFRTDFNEVGRAEDFYTPNVPVGFLECDGTAYSRTGFPDLFAAISTTWGLGTGGDVTTFGVPNLKDTGRFKRSRTGSLAVGTYQSNQNLSHTHVVTGATDTEGSAHTHTYSGTTGTESASHTHTTSGGFIIAGGGTTFTTPGGTGNTAATTSTESATHTHTYSGSTSNEVGSHTHTFTATSNTSGGSEARPEAAVVISCIRY